MIPTKPLFLSAAVLLTACINLPEIDGPPSEDPDAGHTPSLTVTLTAPSGATYTNGTVSVQLQLQGDTPEQVELLVDGQPLTTLQAPYTFTWDTASLAEGPHQLSARARIGDKTFAGEVRDVVVDRTPPQVVSRTPTPGAQDVWVRQPIQATFSEPLKASTVNSDSVTLTVSGSPVPATLSLSADGESLSVTPSSRVPAPSNVQVTLTASISDLAGNPLSTASAWTWSHPVSLSLGSLSIVGDVSGYPTPAFSPSLHLDSSNHPYVVWIEEVDPGPPSYNIYVKHWTGTSWESIGDALDPVWLHNGGGASGQVIETDTSGIPYVAWMHYDLSYSNIHISRWFNNQWNPLGSPIDLGSSSTTYPPFFLSLRFDKTNNPIVSWLKVEPDSHIYINVARWSGQDWSRLGGMLQLYGIPSSAGANASSSLVMDASGTPVIAWPNHGRATPTPEPHGILVQRWDGSQWKALAQAVTARPQSYNHYPKTPYLLLDASGRITLAWSESDGSTYNVHVYRWNDSSSIWEPMGALLSANPGDSPATNPKLAMDGAGNMFVTWEESNPSTGGYEQHIRRWNGTGWESIGSPLLKADTTFPSFAVDANGTPYFAWASDEVLVHRYNN